MSETERDPALDAAWREASREQPPAALDDAIRAAARREVEAAPRRRRDKHWWYPLAAAAMVAVIAVGLLQLTPPEQVAPTVVAQKDTAMEPTAETAPGTKSEPTADQVARSEEGAASGTVGAPPATTAVPRGEPFPASPTIAGRSSGAPPTAALPEPAPSAVAPEAAAPQIAAQSAPRREALAAEGGLMRDRAAQAKDASGEAKPKQARSVDDWIKLMRDLRAEGRVAEAAKELAAFRDAYGERADSLLPADLRELKAPAAGAK